MLFVSESKNRLIHKAISTITDIENDQKIIQNNTVQFLWSSYLSISFNVLSFVSYLNSFYPLTCALISYNLLFVLWVKTKTETKIQISCASIRFAVYLFHWFYENKKKWLSIFPLLWKSCCSFRPVSSVFLLVAHVCSHGFDFI